MRLNVTSVGEGLAPPVEPPPIHSLTQTKNPAFESELPQIVRTVQKAP